MMNPEMLLQEVDLHVVVVDPYSDSHQESLQINPPFHGTIYDTHEPPLQEQLQNTALPGFSNSVSTK